MPEFGIISGGKAGSWGQEPRVALRQMKSRRSLARNLGASNQIMASEFREKEVERISVNKFWQFQDDKIPSRTERDLVVKHSNSNALGAAYERLFENQLHAENNRKLLTKYKARISEEQLGILSSLMGSLHVTGLEQPEDWKYHYSQD